MGKKAGSKIDKGAAQVQIMQHLMQTAVAWLLGISRRSIRDQADLPRKANGTYNAAEAVQWAVARVPRPELADADEEKLLRISDYILGELHDYRSMRTIRDIFADLRSRHGDFALVEFLETFLDELDRDLADRPPPTRHELQEAEQQRQRAEVERRAVAELRVAVVCEACNRLRRGKTWLKKKPPADHLVVTDICPQCK